MFSVMLPEFPRAYDAIQKVWNRIMFDAAGFSDPLISQIAVHVQREGHRSLQGESEMEYKPISVSHAWKPEIGKGMSTEEFFGLPLRLGKEMATGQAKNVFEAMSQPTPRSGSVRRSEGPLTFELWISKMEAFEIDFDEQGIPRWPQWFVSEDALSEVKASMGEGKLTPEQNQRMAELVARKRQEFDEREAHRRLVE
jgi:hypothetical protein